MSKKIKLVGGPLHGERLEATSRYLECTAENHNGWLITRYVRKMIAGKEYFSWQILPRWNQSGFKHEA